jgi:hypothetical protein
VNHPPNLCVIFRGEGVAIDESLHGESRVYLGSWLEGFTGRRKISSRKMANMVVLVGGLDVKTKACIIVDEGIDCCGSAIF